MKGKRWVAVATVTVTGIGLGLVAASAVVDHHHWFSSVAVNLGTTLLLAVPLAWVAHYVGKTIEATAVQTSEEISQVKDDVGHVKIEVDDIRRSTAADIAELKSDYKSLIKVRQAEAVQGLAKLKSEPSYESLDDTLGYAIRAATVSKRGLIVDYGYPDLYCRVGLVGSQFSLEVTPRRTSKVLAITDWSADHSALEVLDRLNTQLVAENALDPEQFNPEVLFSSIASSLSAIEDLRRFYVSEQIGPVVVVANEDWVVTEEELAHRTHHYLAPLNQPMSEGHGWVSHLRGKPWTNYDNTFLAVHWAVEQGLLSDKWAW